MSQAAVLAHPTTGRQREGEQKSSRPRDPFLDNAKMVLVTLVVIGHSWTLADESWFTDRLYNWMYLWHLPAFVLVTGYLSRSFRFSRRHLRSLATTVVLPYLVFEGLLAIFRHVVADERLAYLWINPHWPMWYLAALALWRLATPLLLRAGPWVLPATVVVSLVGGTVSIDVLDLDRVLGFLPFFTAGLLAQPHHLQWLRRRPVRVAGLLVLAAGVPVALLLESHLETEWLYYRSSYGSLGFMWVPGMTVQLGVMVVGAAMALSALAWMPARHAWFTRMGASSLVVYLFHGFVVKGAEFAGLEDWAQGRPWESLLVTTLGGAVLAVLLAWRPVARKLNTVITPDSAVPTPAPARQQVSPSRPTEPAPAAAGSSSPRQARPGAASGATSTRRG